VYLLQVSKQNTENYKVTVRWILCVMNVLFSIEIFSMD